MLGEAAISGLDCSRKVAIINTIFVEEPKFMTIKLSLIATALLITAPVAAQDTKAAPPANDYDNPATWLCRPGHQAVCMHLLPT